MRILHILDHSLPLHSGYSFRTAAILREQRALGWETLQLTTPRHGTTTTDVEEADGFRFHRTPMTQGLVTAIPIAGYIREMTATAHRIDELCESFLPDILQPHSPVLNALPALKVGRERGIPVVYEVRALWEDAAVDHGTMNEGGLRYRTSRAIETFALRHADHFTTICEGLRSEILKRGIAAERVTVIPNAVDASEFRIDVSSAPELRRELGLEGKTVIGFVGSFYGYEGLDLLIEAAAILARHRPELRVLLVGGGPQEGALMSLAAARGIAGRVIFTGRVPHGEVKQYYNVIDVLAFPRRRIRLTDIVTPLKPLEAMAQGRMFVASDVGGHRELIRDRETGRLFRADDVAALVEAIEDVLDHAASWPRVGEQARRFVETERTWTRSVARYAEVYRAVRRLGEA